MKGSIPKAEIYTKISLDKPPNALVTSWCFEDLKQLQNILSFTLGSLASEDMIVRVVLTKAIHEYI